MDFPRHILDHHTLTGDYELSSGQHSSEYIDLRAALLCEECNAASQEFDHPLVRWYMAQIRYPSDGGGRPAIVATGSFGGLLLGAIAALDLAWGSPLLLWNPKGHGVEWSGEEPGRFRPSVVLMDDVATTGDTLRAMREACEARGWAVAAEVVAVDRSRS